MRTPAMLMLVALVGAAQASAQTEIVNGFHGYKWGTRVAEISELRGKQTLPDGDGSAYLVDASMLGTRGTAAFFFDSGGGLVKGAYQFPVTYTNCQTEWAKFESALKDAYPNLMFVTTGPPAMDETDRLVYGVACKYFAYKGDQLEWRSQFLNPKTMQPELGIGITTDRLQLTMMMLYQGDAANHAVSQQEQGDRAKLGPVGGARPTVSSGPVAPAPVAPKPGPDPKQYPFMGNPLVKVYYPTDSDCWRGTLDPDRAVLFKNLMEADGYTLAPACKRNE